LLANAMSRARSCATNNATQIGSKRVPLIWGTVNLLKSWGE